MMSRVLLIFFVMMTGTTVGAQTFESDTFKTKDGRSLKITFIKHASLILNFDGQVIYVDPISEYADYTRLPKADVVLITHEHGDHLDLQAIGAVEKEGTIIVANPSSQEKIGKGMIMNNFDLLKPLSWLQIEAVPAYNTTPGREIYHPKNRDNGYVLTLGGSRIYIAGDTEDIPEMQQLKNIDIAFLPVNQPYTMTVAQADHAARVIQPRVLYPYHYGTTKVEELKNLLKDVRGIEVRIRQLQ